MLGKRWVPPPVCCAARSDPPGGLQPGTPRHHLRAPVPGPEPGGAARPPQHDHRRPGAALGLPAGGGRPAGGLTQALCAAAPAGRHCRPDAGRTTTTRAPAMHDLILAVAKWPSDSVGGCLQGCKVLIVGHPKSFFTLYKPALDSGLGRVCHLDRDSCLLRAPAEQVAAAVHQGAAGAACLLAAVELAAAPGFSTVSLPAGGRLRIRSRWAGGDTQAAGWAGVPAALPGGSAAR